MTDPLAQALQNYDPNQPTLKPYDPTWRDRIAAALMGDGRPSAIQRGFVSGLVGSTGTGSTGPSVADFLPGLGQALGAQDAASHGDYKGAALAMLPIPGASEIAPEVSAAERSLTLPSVKIAADRGEQNQLLRQIWAQNGRQMDWEDLPPSILDREAKAWDKNNGTNIYNDIINGNAWENKAFEQHINNKHLNGKMTEFPGAKEANSWFDARGEYHNNVYIRGKQPVGWDANGNPADEE